MNPSNLKTPIVCFTDPHAAPTVTVVSLEKDYQDEG
jgi:hypothetical protein